MLINHLLKEKHSDTKRNQKPPLSLEWWCLLCYHPTLRRPRTPQVCKRSSATKPSSTRVHNLSLTKAPYGVRKGYGNCFTDGELDRRDWMISLPSQRKPVAKEGAEHIWLTSAPEVGMGKVMRCRHARSWVLWSKHPTEVGKKWLQWITLSILRRAHVTTTSTYLIRKMI